jgi:hypothetical protein
MRITEDEARELLGAANEQGRLRILGNRWFAGVECDGRWIFVEGRRQLAEAAHEWQTLRAMQRQFED